MAEAVLMDLQLEVFINGYPVGSIAAFTLMPDQRVGATRAELQELGIKPETGGAPDELILLEAIPGTSYHYDEAAQSIDIRLSEGRRLAKSYDLSGVNDGAALPESVTGAYVNYSLFGSASNHSKGDFAGFNGGSVQLDSHFFSPLGTFNQSDVIGVTPEGDGLYTRLDSTYSRSSVHYMSTFNAGDTITGGLAWTRPIRIGGLQLKRNFATRPDFVTAPLPSFEGNAAVPSTVEVFVNNIKTHSQEVPEGPFQLDNLPVVSGAGIARIVVRDAQGREVVTEQPFYSPSELLAAGLTDYSVEAGLARLNQGTRSFDYDDALVASGSLRYGLTDWLTIEGHGEAGSGLVNGGAGVVVNGGMLGTFSLAASASHHAEAMGALIHAGWELRKGNFAATASTIRKFGDYADLADATAEESYSSVTVRAADQISVGYSFPGLGASLGASFIHTEQEEENHANLVTATFSQQLPLDISFFASGYMNIEDRDQMGAFAGLSIPLGKTYSSAAGVNMQNGYAQASTTLMKAAKDKPGGAGWRIEYADGEYRRVAASASYLATKNHLQGNAYLIGEEVDANIYADGGIALADGGLYLSRRIHDGFAIVDAGAPGVEVYSQNQLVGRTGKSGKILAPGLIAYRKNVIRIDTNNLPINAEIPETQKEVTVAPNSGSVARFGVQTSTSNGLVELRLSDGSFPPAGTLARLNGADEEFVVGYDGQTYFSNLKPQNSAVLELTSGECTANFAFVPEADRQTFIRGVMCQ
jgi:outer membrane usher protein